jgi:hypothetical protein
MMEACSEKFSMELYVPAEETFQPTMAPLEFEAHVYRVVAQTLVKHKDKFRKAGLVPPSLKKLNQLINSPFFRSRSLSFTSPGGGMGVSQKSDANYSEAFAKMGFRNLVLKQLEQCFPGNSGGIICTLDNLELEAFSIEPRRTLEVLRDKIFNVPQLRWIICGSPSAITAVNSERLSGALQVPLTISRLSESDVESAIERRIQMYSIDESATSPVSPESFVFLYNNLNRNLRDSFSMAHEFSEELYSKTIRQKREIPDSITRHSMLNRWLRDRANAKVIECEIGGVKTAHWNLLSSICIQGGRIRSDHHETFKIPADSNANSIANVQRESFNDSVGILAKWNLATVERDEKDGDLIWGKVTSEGWLYHAFQTGAFIESMRDS